MTEFNSKNWLPKIQKLAAAFMEKADKVHVKYRDLSMPEIERAYPERLHSVKTEAFGVCDFSEKHIDRHKIIALYIQLFLEKPLFIIPDKLASGDKAAIATKLINERFCLMFMKIVLESWSGKTIDWNKFESYKISFIKLLYAYKKHSEFHNKNSLFTHVLAHIVYFIEQHYTH